MDTDHRAIEVTTRAVVDGMRACGVPVDELTGALGLPTPLDQSPVTSFPGNTFDTLWAAAIARTDPALPLRVGEAVPLGVYEFVDYIGFASDTVGECFRQVARYFSLITTRQRWRVIGDHEPPLVELRHVGDGDSSRPPFTLFAIAVTLTRVRKESGCALALASVRLSAPQPADPAPFEDFFGCDVSFGHEFDQLAIHREDWQRPFPRADARLRALLERQAEHIVRARGLDDPLREVRAAVRAALAQGDARLDVVAATVGQSARSLQRHLRQEGTGFRALVEDERRVAALTWLREGRRPIGEIAYLLGYSEPSAFLRAFKRWTGQTPSDYRAS